MHSLEVMKIETKYYAEFMNDTGPLSLFPEIKKKMLHDKSFTSGNAVLCLGLRPQQAPSRLPVCTTADVSHDLTIPQKLWSVSRYGMAATFLLGIEFGSRNSQESSFTLGRVLTLKLITEEADLFFLVSPVKCQAENKHQCDLQQTVSFATSLAPPRCSPEGPRGAAESNLCLPR